MSARQANSGVQACVAAIVSAYRDGDGIIQSIKEKRAAKRASPPPASLERSIVIAPRDIEQERRRGIERFGPAFDRGDYVAIFAIQDITIQLQGSLLKRLHDATVNAERADFRGLADAADIGRDSTIAALIALQQRLMQAAPIAEMSALSLGTGRDIGHSGQYRTQHISIPQVYAATRGSERQSQSWEPQHDSLEVMASGAGSGSARGSRQRFGFFGRREQRHSVSHPSGVDARHPSAPSSGPQRVFTLPADMPEPERTLSSNSTVSRQTPTFQYHEGEDNPFEIWGSHRQPSNAPPPTTRSLSQASDQVDTPMRALSIASGSSAAPARPPSHEFRSVATPHPSEENDYLGFCKGAWRLQNGDRKKAVTLSTDWSTRSATSNVEFTICRKCKFECHSNPKTIWTQVWVYGSLGIKLRWPFLAKSHVPQQTTLDRQDARQCMFCYKCMFCVFEGLGGNAPVIHGLSSYLQHISQTHRETPLSEVVLYKTHCIQGRSCNSNEKFDINLFPVSGDVVELG